LRFSHASKRKNVTAPLGTAGVAMSDVVDLVSRTADGVIAVDPSQRIVHWNHAAEALFGIEAEKALGRFCYEVIGLLDDSGCVICQQRCFAVTAARRRELVLSRELRVRNSAAQDTWVSVSTIMVPSRWSRRVALIHLVRDVTYQREMKGIMEQLRSRLTDGPPHRASDAPVSPCLATPANSLTTREREVLRLLSSGASTKAISEKLFISPLTARNHIRNLLGKLGVSSRLQAILVACKQGLL